MDPIKEETESLISREARTKSQASDDKLLTNTVGNSAIVSASGAWQLKQEKESGFVTFNPFKLLWNFRNAKILTVEPVIFLYMLGVYWYFPLYQQYYFNQISKQVIGNSSLLPNGSYCLTSNETDKLAGNGSSTKVEAITSNLLIYTSLANQIPAIFTTLLYGPLSDRFGRKPILLIVAFSSFIQGLLALGIVYFELSVYYFIIPSFISGLSGDFAAVIMASFAYISDISSKKWLTFRIGFVEAMLFLAGGTGEGAGGYWFQTLNCNFIPPLFFYIGTSALLLAYILLFLPESLSRRERELQMIDKVKGVKALVRGCKIYFCQIKSYAVWVLWLSLIAIGVLVMTSAGAQRISIAFLKAPIPFDWNPSTIGQYQMIAQFSHMLGLLVVLPILVAFKLPDAFISLIGLTVNIGMNLFTGLAKQTWEMFLIVSIQGIEAIMFPPLRSIQSKAVDKADQGALFSVVASVELLGTLLSGVIFPVIIPLALSHGISPGIAYLLMACICVIPLICLLFLLVFGKRRNLCRRYKKESAVSPNGINDGDFISDKDKYLAPGHVGTYPPSKSKLPRNRTGVRSLV